jgi:hypothetical protein
MIPTGASDYWSATGDVVTLFVAKFVTLTMTPIFLPDVMDSNSKMRKQFLARDTVS